MIRSYGTTESTTAHIGKAIEAERSAGVNASTLNALMFPSGELFAVLTVSAVVVVGVIMGPASGLTAGELVGFMLLVNRFLEPVAEVTEILDETQTAVSGWRRVLDLLDTPIDIVEPDPGVVLPPGPPSIAVEHVSFSYRPRPGSNETPEPALRDVSVVIDPGTSVAVVGATGSGKTTFAKLLTRLADPTEGRILISGVDLRDVERTSLRSSLVMVPQDAFLFDTTIAGTSASAGPADADAVRPRSSSSASRRGSTPWPTSSRRASVSGASTSPWGSASSSLSPAPTSRTLSASSSTRRRQPSTPRSRPAWRGRSRASLAAARR